MILHCLFVQRKCRYVGEYAPELYDSIDEFGMEENPEFMEEKLSEVRSDGSIESFAVIDVNVSLKEIQKILGRQCIEGEIKS